MDTQPFRFRDDVMFATYNDREASGAIKLLHMPAPLLRPRRELKSLVHLCGQTPDAPKQPKITDQYGLPAPMPSALKQEPTLIPLPSKELCCLKRRQEKYSGLTKRERQRLKKKRQAAQRKMQTVKPPEEAKAAVKANQRKIRTEPHGIRKLRSLIYDSGADDHYPTEALRKEASLKTLRRSTKTVLVADGTVNQGEYEVDLPFDGLSKSARKGNTFNRFTESLMSVGKVNDDGNISIFTQDDVTVYNEEDVLITCRGKPILVGVRDDKG